MRFSSVRQIAVLLIGHALLRPVCVALILFACFSAPYVAFAQEQGVSQSDTQNDKRALEERVDSLEKALAALRAQMAAMQSQGAAQSGVPTAKSFAPSPGTAASVAAPAPQGPIGQAQTAQTTSGASGSTALPVSGQSTPSQTDVAQNTRQKSAPNTQPGSTTPAASGTNPAAVINQTIGENQPTQAQQAQHGFFERKPGRDLTFYTHGGELTTYGNLDLSFDVLTKGISQLRGPDGLAPVGNLGWLPDISTNVSFIGIRGTQSTNFKNLNLVYQLETLIDISATSGVAETNSAASNDVRGALTSRNSYIGLGSKNVGAVLFGKTDAPYRQSTARLDPFFGMIGDYAVIMGNTGGDNRVEFAGRLDHSIWYSSPNLHGINFNTLYSPGQNRSSTEDNIAAGEASCTGGDIPGSGGSLPFACNDGGFGDAVSASVAYTREPLYIVAAYERHLKVNRQSDLTGPYANVPTLYYDADVADEDAGKVGVQYTFQRKTTASVMFETLHRYVPDFLAFQNERQRLGSWIAVTQAVSSGDSISLGWARAFRAPGDPGQHNTSLALPPLGAPGDSTGGLGVNNAANFFTVAYKHRIGDGLTAYTNWAGTFNGPYAHYDLGAGGHGITTDCHDASDATGGESSNPHCWAGGQLIGTSLGLVKRF